MKTFLILVLAVCVLSSSVNGSELQNWIHEKFSECCDHKDCYEISKESATPVEGGWEVIWKGTAKFVAEKNTKPSPFGVFWLCENSDGSIRCFGRPSMGI